MTNNISSINSNFAANFVADSLKTIPTAAYIHIPFCRRRCYYCDFPISVVGDRDKPNGQGVSPDRRLTTTGDATASRASQRAASVMMEEYVTALIEDIKLTPSVKQPLETVFFGGGTPSLLSPHQLKQILQTIAWYFGIANDAEISMEIDPGTFDRERLLGYLDAGVNRFSLGVQSFDDELLKICGRSHTSADVMQAISIIQQLGIDNFSLDLISGLPHQTLQHCQTSLERAIAIAPQHLSCYDLVLEPVTAFGKQYQPGETPLPSDDITAQMYRLAQRTLTAAGYEHYEISNYARSGYQCRHNRVYWKNQTYYGWGMGAASYVAGRRFSRPRTRREYYAWLKQGAVVDAPETSATDYLLETLMLGLRLAEGIDLTRFDLQIQAIWSCLEPYHQRKWVEIVAGGRSVEELDLNNSSFEIRLNDPEGFLFSNTILAALFESFA